jgi:hypothetical protein
VAGKNVDIRKGAPERQKGVISKKKADPKREKRD